MDATVHHLKKADGDLIFEVEFMQPARLERYLSSVTFSFFNRRKSFRVRPSPEQHITLTVQPTTGDPSIEMES